MKFGESLQFGKVAESEIARWLRSLGWNTLPVYEIEKDCGKGPVLYQSDGPPLVAPDLLAFKDGTIKWFEVKRKTACTYYRRTGRFQTGINKRHFDQYVKVKRVSNWPILLLFLQENGVAKDTPTGLQSPTGLFCGEIDRLEREVDHCVPDQNGVMMVYWNIESLKRVRTLEEIRGVTASRTV